MPLFVFGVTAPSRPGHPHSRGFWITHNGAPRSVGLFWTRDQLVAETSIRQHKQHSQHTHVHAPVGFETTISAGERPQTSGLDRAATGTGNGIPLLNNRILQYVRGSNGMPLLNIYYTGT
jgi:hypothetical protein